MQELLDYAASSQDEVCGLIINGTRLFPCRNIHPSPESHFRISDGDWLGAENNTITNNSFTSTESRVGQGHPAPLLLGQMVVAPNVVSLGIDTSNNQNWNISIS